MLTPEELKRLKEIRVRLQCVRGMDNQNSIVFPGIQACIEPLVKIRGEGC